MALYQQSASKYWWISIYRGKNIPRLRVSTRTTDRDEALAIEATLRRAQKGSASRDKLVAAIDALMGHEDSTPRVAISRAWEVYSSLPNTRLSPAMAGIRRAHLHAFMDWLAGMFPSIRFLDEVSRDAAIQYADHLQKRLKTGKTFNHHRADLHAIWNALTYRAGLQENVWSVIPRATEESRSGRAFTDDEEAKILEACDRDTSGLEWRAACLVGLYTGLRLGDIAGLRWDQVREGWLDVTPSKTQRHGFRAMIPLHRRLVELFEGLPRVSGWVLPALHDSSRYRRNFRAIVDDAGIADEGAKLSFHCWRHTWRSRLAEAGVPQDVARRLGAPSTTLDETVYNQDVTSLRRAIDSLS